MKGYLFSLRFRLLLIFLGASLLSPTSSVSSGVILHVTPDGSTTGDCSDNSWNNSCTLEYALDVAQSGDEIWVKGGIYLPAKNGDKDASFILRNGVSVYGGFAGDEVSRTADRRWRENETILSGDLLGNDSDTARCVGDTCAENSYHVVTADGAGSSTLLDGFTIRGGYAMGGSFGDAPFSGGGISMYRSSPILRNLIIVGNAAPIANGGGMLIGIDSSPRLINVLITGNTAGLQGGAVHIQNGIPVLTNVTIIGNGAAESGGAISLFYGSILIRNSIIWGNTDPFDRPVMIMNPGELPVITHSDIEGGCPESVICDNTDRYDDPNFINARGTDDLYGTRDDNPRLHILSPVINQGNNEVTDPTLPGTDLDGMFRIVQGTVDMGAFERQLPPIFLPCILLSEP